MSVGTFTKLIAKIVAATFKEPGGGRLLTFRVVLLRVEMAGCSTASFDSGRKRKDVVAAASHLQPSE